MVLQKQESPAEKGDEQSEGPRGLLRSHRGARRARGGAAAQVDAGPAAACRKPAIPLRIPAECRD